MTTIRVTFDRAILPRRFSWLAQHTCIVSAPNYLTARVYAGKCAVAAVKRATPPSTTEEILKIGWALIAEELDWTVSVFEMRGVDVSGSPPAGENHE